MRRDQTFHSHHGASTALIVGLWAALAVVLGLMVYVASHGGPFGVPSTLQIRPPGLLSAPMPDPPPLPRPVPAGGG